MLTPSGASCDNRLVRRLIPVLVVSLTLAACGLLGPSKNRTRELTGTVEPLGTTIPPDHHFKVTKNGEFELELAEFSAGPNIQVGVSLGTSAPGGGCLDLIVRFLFRGQNFTGPMFSGDYCVAVFDRGALTEPATYRIRLSTPN